MPKLHELQRARATKSARMLEIANKESELPEGDSLPEADASEFEALKTQIAELDGRISRLEEAMAADAASADPAEGDTGEGDGESGDDDDTDKAARPGATKAGFRDHSRPAPRAKDKKLEPGLLVAAAMKMMILGGGNVFGASSAARQVYGENHPVVKALLAGVGPSGGFLVPPDYVAEIIEILRPMTVVRQAGPRIIGMPRGTLTLPRQSQAATATYGSEVAAIPATEQRLDAIVASYKKLTALVPVSNDLLRYSDPSADAMVRDDLAEVLARREDLAFLRGDGTAGAPRGFRSFVLAAAIILSNTTFTQATVNSEIAGAMTRLRQGNVPQRKPYWFMAPRTEMYLYSLLNTQGQYVYRDEMDGGKLMGIPYLTTTQIPVNLDDGAGHTDCSEIYLVEMTQALLLDSMTLEIAVSREATYLDSTGTAVNAFQQDQTVVRAIAEHDFQMRHPEAIAVISNVRWAPS